MVINFRTAYYEDDGSIVLEYARIRQRYLRTYFFFDLAATIPFDRFIELGGVSASDFTSAAVAAAAAAARRRSRWRGRSTG